MRPAPSLFIAVLLTLVLQIAAGTRAVAELPAERAIPTSDAYILNQWDMNDGLPSNHVSGLAQSPDGYLWLVTPKGLSRFDGMAFTPATFAGVPSSEITRVFSAQDGALWVLTKSGAVARGKGHEFDALGASAGDAVAPEVPLFSEDRAGGIWFPSKEGARPSHWYKGGGLTTDSDNSQTPGAPALVRFLSGEPKRALEQPERQNLRLAAAGDGTVWVAWGNHLQRWKTDGSEEEVADMAWLGGADEISRLYESREGDLWMGTRHNGLFRFRKGQFVRVQTSYSAISAIMEDRAGNLWVGTLWGGLNRLHPRGFSFRWPQDRIVSLALDEKRELWAAVGPAMPPIRAADAADGAFSVAPGWSGGLIFALAADPPRGLWLVGSGGLTLWKDGVFQPLLENASFTALLPDRQGGVWISPNNGPLLHFREGKSRPFPTDAGLVDPRPLAADPQGRVWVGTEGGRVFRQEGDRFVEVPLRDASARDPIRFIVPEGDRIWIGTAWSGLYCWQAGKVSRLVPGESLPKDELQALAFGLDGDFWMGTERGLFRLKREAVQAALRGQSVAMPLYFGSDDGLPTTGFGPGFCNVSVRPSEESLCFSTIRGILKIDLPIFRFSNVDRLQIDQFRVGEAALPLANGGKLIVPPRSGLVSVQYTLPDLAEAKRLRFRHRLVGLGKGEWFFAGDQRMATFPYLPPGDYRFEVQASRGDGYWLPQTATLAFTVQAAWWETTGFRIAAGLALLLSLSAIVKWIVSRRLQARLRQLESENALELERSRIARNMHDDIGAGLTHLALLSDVAAIEPSLSPESARHVSEIAVQARSIATTLDRVVWTVNPKNDTLDRLFGYVSEYAAEFLKKTDLPVRLNVPTKIPAILISSNTRHEILLACKEALNNIVKHADADQVTLSFSHRDDRLQIVIADDGSGFDPALARTSGNGLGNMRKRIADLGGSAQIESANTVGTTITLHVPLEGKRKTGSLSSDQ